jgi:hypothetical protein
VFDDGVLRLHHVGRGGTEFKSLMATIMMFAHCILAFQEHANTAQVVELVLEYNKAHFEFYPLQWNDV